MKLYPSDAEHAGKIVDKILGALAISKSLVKHCDKSYEPVYYTRW